MRHIGLLWRRGAFGDDDDEHSSFFSFFSSSTVFPASTVATGRGYLGSKAEFRDLVFFAQCEEKRPKGTFGLGVFKQGMSENSTMEH